MKIIFDDQSYLELTKDSSGDKVFITIAAKNPTNSQSLIINSVLIEKEKLKSIIEDLLK